MTLNGDGDDKIYESDNDDTINDLNHSEFIANFLSWIFQKDHFQIVHNFLIILP